MNTDKAKRLLKKAQALFDNLSDQGTMSALERDLLLSYLRDLYEEISSPQVHVTSTHETIQEPVRMTIDKPVSDFPVPPKTTMQTPTWQEPPKQIVPEPIHTQVEKIVTPVKQEFVEPLTEIKIKKTPVSETLSSAGKAETITTDPLLSALFEFKEVGELAEKLKLQPIDKIEHGMGINERILTVNELFSGDNELFRKTLEDLNSLQNFNEAQGYLIDGVATRFNWADETKKNKASYFIQLVRRRYARNN